MEGGGGGSQNFESGTTSPHWDLPQVRNATVESDQPPNLAAGPGLPVTKGPLLIADKLLFSVSLLSTSERFDCRVPLFLSGYLSLQQHCCLRVWGTLCSSLRLDSSFVSRAVIRFAVELTAAQKVKHLNPALFFRQQRTVLVGKLVQCSANQISEVCGQF